MSEPVALVVGEALMDVVRSPDGKVRHRPGGSPANVAVGLARLGVSTELLCSLGPEAHGAALRAHLVAAGVVLRSPMGPAPSATSTAEARLDADGAASYHFDISWDPGPFEAGPVRLLHTGSLAAVVEPGADDVVAALAAADPGTLISLDPNVRPSLGLGPEQVRVRCELAARHAHVVKMSDEDLSWMYPGASLDLVAERLHGLGVRLLVVTRGVQGCVLAAPGWRSELPAPSVPVVDTIGAGDSFMSGLLFAILASGGDAGLRTGTMHRHQAEAWARIALRSAAITVGRAGAQPPLAEELPQEVAAAV